jgi:hypothetical protein
MAAPTYVGADVGLTDAGGAWGSSLTYNAAGAGNIVIAHVLQDGTTGGAVALDGGAINFENLEDLAGTDDALTSIGSFTGGGLIQHLWIGRTISSGVSTGFGGSNSTSQDVYFRFYEFTNGNTGTTLASVIEQNGTTTPATSSGTSATIADADVITTGPDRLALNFVGGNDDNALDAFTGMSGGTWAEAVAEFASASGTDGVIGLQTAAMASAGTIGGGTDGWADGTDGWGVVGFALIGTTSAAAPSLIWQPAAPTPYRL